MFVDNNVRLYIVYDISISLSIYIGVALGVDVKELLPGVDSVSICLSKGLASPIGSLLCGNKEFIYNALRLRKALGGGMRQVGIIASAGLISLNDMIDRLKDDHQHCKQISQYIQTLYGFICDSNIVDTNIVYIHIDKNKLNINGSELKEIFKSKYNILITNTDIYTIRLVTHYMITQQDIQPILDAFKEVSEKYRV